MSSIKLLKTQKKSCKLIKPKRKYIGFYRPWGYQDHIYTIFQTQHKNRYIDTVRKQHENLESYGLFEIATDFCGIRPMRMKCIVTKRPRKIDRYQKLIWQLRKDGNTVRTHKKNKNLPGGKFFATVHFTNENHNNHYMWNVLDNIKQTKLWASAYLKI